MSQCLCGEGGSPATRSVLVAAAQRVGITRASYYRLGIAASAIERGHSGRCAECSTLESLFVQSPMVRALLDFYTVKSAAAFCFEYAMRCNRYDSLSSSMI